MMHYQREWRKRASLEKLLDISLVLTDIKEEAMNSNKIHIFEKEIKHEVVYLEAIIRQHRNGCRIPRCPCCKRQVLSQSDFYTSKKKKHKDTFFIDTLFLAGHIFNTKLPQVHLFHQERLSSQHKPRGTENDLHHESSFERKNQKN